MIDLLQVFDVVDGLPQNARLVHLGRKTGEKHSGIRPACTVRAAEAQSSGSGAGGPCGVQVLSLPLTSCVTQDKVLSMAKLHQVYNGGNTPPRVVMKCLIQGLA